MLKEITRAEAVEKLAKEKPVFALFEIDGDMTINDLLTADGFVIEVEEEPRNEVSEADSEVKRTSSETKRKSSEKKKAEKTSGKNQHYDRGKVAALTKAGWSVKQIADELGCTDNTVRYIQKKNKEAEIKAESEGTEVNYDN